MSGKLLDTNAVVALQRGEPALLALFKSGEEWFISSTMLRKLRLTPRDFRSLVTARNVEYNRVMALNEKVQARRARRQYIEATHTSVVVAGVMLAAAGWIALAWIITNKLPTVPNRWMFFALLQIALTGTALPLVRYLNQRFGRQGGLFVEPGVLVRQATWIGLLGTSCAWLRIPRLLSIPLFIILALALAGIETLMRIRERTQWKPE